MVIEVVAEAVLVDLVDLVVAEEVRGVTVVEAAAEVVVVGSAAALTVAVEDPGFVAVLLAGVDQSYSTKVFLLRSHSDSRTPVFLP